MRLLEIPLPPTVNNKYVSKNTKILSREYRDYIENIGLLFKGHIKQPYDCPVELVAGFHMGATSDIDNRLKPLLDALQGVCYKNDRQIHKLDVVKVVVKPKDYKAYVKVSPLYEEQQTLV